MFIAYNHPSVRASGRWAPVGNALCATATGSYVELAFRGTYALLRFDQTWSQPPYPHVWLSVDGGAQVEVPLDRYLRVSAPEGDHVVKILLKGAVEQQHRWYHPLVGKIAFLGYDAEAPATLPEDPRKTIEFVGDSITEGVLIDAFLHDHKNDQLDRPYMDDVCATYAYLTAQALGLRSLHCGYGATGITRSGCGGVPKVSETYPYCFQNAPVTYDHPDYILINHGANDRGAGCEAYINGYREFLKQVRAAHPESKIIVLSAFVGAWPQELGALVKEHNLAYNDDVFFVDTTDWIPKDPLHPLRDGHRIVANNLIPLLKERYSL